MRTWRAVPVLSRRVVPVAIIAFFLSFALVPAARAETAETVSFLDFLQDFRQEALEQGIPEAVLEATLDTIREPHAQTLARFNRQVEFTTDFSDYLQNRVVRGRLLRGQKLLKRYEKQLTQLEEQYGVSRYILVALWGIESDFGQNKGKYEVIPSLATLGWQGRRAAFFRKQLLICLQLVTENLAHRPLEQILPGMRGSWAGAMGHFQFIPSSIQAYAVDGDGDQFADIWQNEQDGLASASFYLSSHGWRAEQPWAQRVTALPTGKDRAALQAWGEELGRQKLAFWRQMGLEWAPVKRAKNNQPANQPGGNSEAAVLDPTLEAELVFPSPARENEVYLVFHNYTRLLLWNRSHHFALTVGALAHALEEASLSSIPVF